MTTTIAAASSAATDALYRERAILLAAWIATTAADAVLGIEGADPKLPGYGLLRVDTPAGRLFWHIHPRDFDLFRTDYVEWTADPDDPRLRWDGADKAQTLGRILRLVGIDAPAVRS